MAYEMIRKYFEAADVSIEDDSESLGYNGYSNGVQKFMI